MQGAVLGANGEGWGLVVGFFGSEQHTGRTGGAKFGCCWKLMIFLNRLYYRNGNYVLYFYYRLYIMYTLQLIAMLY